MRCVFTLFLLLSKGDERNVKGELEITFLFFKMVFLRWHWEEDGLVISNKGGGPRLNVFERQFFFIGCNLCSRSILCNFVPQFYFASPPPCKASEL